MILRRFVLFFVILIGTLFATELLIRARYAWFSSFEEKASRDFYMKVQSRIYYHWQHPVESDPFLPPYRVFADADFENKKRLLGILSLCRQKPGSWRSFDFLQDENLRSKTSYDIQINSHGFRDIERSTQKPAGVRRIFVIGDYHAFGHGVSGSDTYASVLEREINKNKLHQKFEVWNDGRHGDTAISGLARMQNDIEQYVPDLFIIDYGFVDPLVFGDDVMFASMFFPDFFRPLMRFVTPYFERSMLFFSLQSYLFHRSFESRAERFQSVLRAMVRLAASQNVPVIFVRELESFFRNDVYTANIPDRTKIADYYLDVRELFARHPPAPDAYVHPERSWVSEIPGQALNAPGITPYVFWPYRLDAFQLSPLGHALIGRALAEKVALDLNR